MYNVSRWAIIFILILPVLALPGAAQNTIAGRKARWIELSNMHQARSAFSATMLPTGQVLVAGGVSEDTVLATAERFDPVHRIWTMTGSLLHARWAHTATLLPNGDVLVAGGIGADGQPLRSAEVYDSAAGKWRETGSMIYVRAFHTATRLHDGDVLVAGGGIQAAASAEIFNPRTGRWRLTGAMRVKRNKHQAVLLPSGNALVMGGDGASTADPHASAEEYDPDTGQWMDVAPMHRSRDQFTATLLPDGRVLVVGSPANADRTSLMCVGSSQISVASGCRPIEAEIFDARHNDWTIITPPIASRVSQAAAMLPDGTVLIMGGSCGDLNTGACLAPLRSSERYCPSSARWIADAALHTGREGFQATVLPGGMVLVSGGFTTRGRSLRTVVLASSEMYIAGSGNCARG